MNLSHLVGKTVYLQLTMALQHVQTPLGGLGLEPLIVSARTADGQPREANAAFPFVSCKLLEDSGDAVRFEYKTMAGQMIETVLNKAVIIAASVGSDTPNLSL